MSKKLFTVMFLLAAMVAFTLSQPVAAGPPVKLVVVVAKGSAVTSLSKDDLKRAFLSENVTAGGKKLVPFNFNPATPERTGFDKAVLGMSPEEAGRFWIDRKVRGQAAAPRALPSVAHMQKVVAKFPGAIGYLPENAVTAELQVVNVSGLNAVAQ